MSTLRSQDVRWLLRATVRPVHGHAIADSSHRPLYPRRNGSCVVPGLITRGDPMKPTTENATSYGSVVTRLPAPRCRWSELAYVYSSARLYQLVGVPPRLPVWGASVF